jgi:hypothetical protein
MGLVELSKVDAEEKPGKIEAWTFPRSKVTTEQWSELMRRMIATEPWLGAGANVVTPSAARYRIEPRLSLPGRPVQDWDIG